MLSDFEAFNLSLSRKESAGLSCSSSESAMLIIDEEEVALAGTGAAAGFLAPTVVVDVVDYNKY